MTEGTSKGDSRGRHRWEGVEEIVLVAWDRGDAAGDREKAPVSEAESREAR